MFFWETVGRPSIYQILHDIDRNFALEEKAARCRRCSGTLDHASYQRKPRGGPVGLAEELSVRFSLCCRREGCRRRVLPKSVLFDGRRVYWRAIILVTVALREQRSKGFTMRRLQEELQVDSKTVRRWQAWYRQRIVEGDWRGVGGRFAQGLEPGLEASGMLSFFFKKEQDAQGGIVRLLVFLAGYEHLDPGAMKSTQKMGSVQRGKFLV